MWFWYIVTSNCSVDPHCPDMKPTLCIKHKWHSIIWPLLLHTPKPVLLILSQSPRTQFWEHALLLQTPFCPWSFPSFPQSALSHTCKFKWSNSMNISTMKLSGWILRCYHKITIGKTVFKQSLPRSKLSRRTSFTVLWRTCHIKYVILVTYFGCCWHLIAFGNISHRYFKNCLWSHHL